MVFGEYMTVNLCVLSRGVRDEGVHCSLVGVCCRDEVRCPGFKDYVTFGVELVVGIRGGNVLPATFGRRFRYGGQSERWFCRRCFRR